MQSIIKWANISQQLIDLSPLLNCKFQIKLRLEWVQFALGGHFAKQGRQNKQGITIAPNPLQSQRTIYKLKSGDHLTVKNDQFLR